ncbi:PhnA protein [Arachidicoccus ginsenosidimutans]|uniref:PhnA domain-containing protein n=1 Tax=Arachidicoccus sp. BS20 TaxID=1850526 RepID=UPI0007F0FC92|nr:alkylphosphonate utilization protein [Arachidicoccus sp. BS20]ANI88010.1 PhnA protein [Arachidicoccus sp. BS20]
MNLTQLQERSNNACELCAATGNLNIYDVPPTADNISDREIYICDKCLAQIEKKEELDSNHWQCLTTSMWSETTAVQVVAWRMLNRLRNESWAADNLDMLYLDDAILDWAKATGDHENDANVDLHRDANGAVLNNGDTVVLTKSLDVKGSTVNARLGTVVKNIRLDANDTGYIEGKIEGQSIMIKTIFVRKQGV